jgi:hypothetical protein
MASWIRISLVAAACAASPMVLAQDKPDAAVVDAAKPVAQLANPPVAAARKWRYLRVVRQYDVKKRVYFLSIDDKRWDVDEGLDYLGGLGFELIQEVVFPGDFGNEALYLFKREIE